MAQESPLKNFQNPSLVLHGPRKVTIEERPYPEIQDPHDVLIKVLATGICGSDLHYYNHGRIAKYVVNEPMTLGHESAGVVTEVGQEVTTLKRGDRVALEAGIPCRYCDYCRGGTYNLCRKMRFAATPPYDGTLCDIYCLPEDFCHKIPDVLSLEEGAMAEPLSVAVHVMLKQAHVRLGSHIVVFGAGPIGLLCCAVAKAYGAEKIVAVDIDESRLHFAIGYAATDAFDAKAIANETTERAAEILSQQKGIQPDGADIAVDASGAESSIRLGIHLLRPGGTFVQAGMGKDDVKFPIAAMCSKELNVRGNFRYGPGDYEIAIKLMASGRIHASELITQRLPFMRAEEAFRKTGGENIKTIIAGLPSTL